MGVYLAGDVEGPGRERELGVVSVDDGLQLQVEGVLRAARVESGRVCAIPIPAQPLRMTDNVLYTDIK